MTTNENKGINITTAIILIGIGTFLAYIIIKRELYIQTTEQLKLSTDHLQTVYTQKTNQQPTRLITILILH